MGYLEKDRACLQCKETFNNSEMILVGHMVKNTEYKVFSCPFCKGLEVVKRAPVISPKTKHEAYKDFKKLFKKEKK